MRSTAIGIVFVLMILVFGTATSASAMGCGIFGTGLGFAGGHGLWGSGYGFERGYGLWGSGCGLWGPGYTYANYPYTYVGYPTGTVYSYRRPCHRHRLMPNAKRFWWGWRRGRSVRVSVYR